MANGTETILHNDHRVVYDDADSAKLVSTFCQFFVDKISQIRDNITKTLRTSLVARSLLDHAADRICQHFNQ